MITKNTTGMTRQISSSNRNPQGSNGRFIDSYNHNGRGRGRGGRNVSRGGRGRGGRGHGRDNDSRIGFNSQNTDNRPITRGYSREEW